MFPVCIFGTFACCIGLAVLDPAAMGEQQTIATLLKFYQNGISTQFSNFTYSSNKLLGVLAMQFLLV
jgi:cytochrome b6-f complex subunit 4